MVIVEGKIKGKDRPRFFRGHAVTSAATREYEKLVKDSYIMQDGRLLETPVKISITIFHKVPKSASKKDKQLIRDGIKQPIKKPDIDNVAKIILDSLNGVAFRDDAQVIKLSLVKKYTESIERVEFEVKEYKC